MLLPPRGQDVLYTWGAQGGRPLPAENFAAPGSAVPLKSRSGCLCCVTRRARRLDRCGLWSRACSLLGSPTTKRSFRTVTATHFASSDVWGVHRSRDH